jgi:hypothetical protein|tara:strand:+ start:206 stop:406 length:201 start_codon:yes stop_codon:yes gene_type:complete
MDDVSNIDFSQVKQTSEETLRLSIDKTQTVLKFSGETPNFLVGLQQYNHSEILAIMASSDWTNEEE